MSREEAFIQTYTGIHFYPWAVTAEMITIKDIAHSLSLTNRWGGHTEYPYSVASHSLAAAKEAKARGLSKKMQGIALMHDAAEAYIGDMPKPIKNTLPEYERMEDNIVACIFLRYGLGVTGELPEEIHAIDKALGIEEACQLLPIAPSWVPDEIEDEMVLQAEHCFENLTPRIEEERFVQEAMELLI